MSTLVNLVGVTVALFLVARMCASMPCKSIAQLPFIVAITHGTCPRCGRCHPDRATFVKEPKQFWQRFSCGKCGYSISAHIEDRE